MINLAESELDLPGYPEALIIQRSCMVAGYSCAILYPKLKASQGNVSESNDVLVVVSDTIDEGTMDCMTAARSSRDSGPLLVVLSADADNARLVDTLKAGADEFLVYPLESRVITARIEALCRRASEPRLPIRKALRVGPYELVDSGQFARLREQRIALTPRQFALARLMFANPGRIMSTSSIERAIWGRELPATSRALSELVSRTRRSLCLCLENGVTMTGLYARGYRLDINLDRPQQSSPGISAWY